MAQKLSNNFQEKKNFEVYSIPGSQEELIDEIEEKLYCKSSAKSGPIESIS